MKLKRAWMTGGVCRTLLVLGALTLALIGASAALSTPPAAADVDCTAVGDDQYEENDTLAEAKQFNSGATVTGHACGGDQDWFSIAATSGASIQVDVAFLHAEGDIDVVLRDADGTQLAASTSEDDNESITYVATASDTYYVQLYEFTGADDNDYDLTVTVDGCIDDDLEDNDSTGALATSMVSGVAQSAVHCDGDPDVFSIAAVAGDTIDIDVSFTHADGDLAVFLIGPPANGVLSEANTATDDETISYVVPVGGDGTYYASVISVGVFSNSYDITMTVTTPCVDDDFEPNDFFNPAALTSGVQVSAVLCDPDQDWFSISANAGDTIDVEVLFVHAEGDLSSYTYPPTGAALGGTSSSTDNEVYSVVATESGTHKVQVHGDGGAVTNYQLTVTVTPPCVDDDLEENDSTGTATMTESGVALSGVHCAGDIDYFRIDANAGDTIQIDLTFTHADGDLDLALGTPGTLIAQSTSLDDNEGISYLAAANGPFYATVYSSVNASNSYDLTVTVTPPCVEDDLEDNDFLVVATQMVTGVQQSGVHCDGDNDYFQIDALAGDTIDVELLFTRADGDLALVLYSVTGDALQDSLSSTDNESISYLVPADGTYYAGVYSGGTDSNSYDITMTVTTPCTDDGYEDNDTAGTATAIVDGSHINAHLCAPDEDWYEVTLAAGEFLVLQAGTSTEPFPAFTVRVLDPSGNELTNSTSPFVFETVTAVEAGVYKVHVAPESGASAGYTLIADIYPSCTDDEYEVNDGFDSATPLESGVGVSAMMCHDNIDTFSIQVQAGDTIDIQALFSAATGEIDIELFDPADNSVDGSFLGGDNEELRHVATETGYYKVWLYAGGGGAVTPYNLTVTVAPPCTDDDLEDNDTSSAATVIDDGAVFAAQLCAFDEDWYEFTLAAGEFAVLRVESAAPDFSDLAVRTLDPAGSEIESLVGPSNYPEVAAAESGVYRVQVAPIAGESTGYSMVLDIYPVCTDDDFEENDDFDSAANLASGVSVSAIACHGDSDYFSIEVQAGDEIDVEALFSASTGDLDLILLDPDGGYLSGGFSSDDNEEVQYVATTSGIHGVQLFASGGGAATPYDLTVTVTPPQLLCNGLVVTIDLNANGGDGVGTSGVDVILGTPAADVISGLGGDDTICGGGGDDTISGGDGVDTIFGEAGFDVITGGNGDDVIDGGANGDTINGEFGDDTIVGGGGWDRLTGASGDDSITGGQGDDQLFGGGGVDMLDGGIGNDLILGYHGNDVITGGDGKDLINGQNDDDTIDGGAQHDQIWGRLGDDTINGGGGYDWIWGYWGDDIIDGGAGPDSIFAEGGNDTVIGGPGDDLLDGSFGTDNLSGGDGNDTLNGGFLDDILDGGAGTDTCDGGGGTDTATTCETLIAIP